MLTGPFKCRLDVACDQLLRGQIVCGHFGKELASVRDNLLLYIAVEVVEEGVFAGETCIEAAHADACGLGNLSNREVFDAPSRKQAEGRRNDPLGGLAAAILLREPTGGV